jgi:hypothetical protein
MFISQISHAPILLALGGIWQPTYKGSAILFLVQTDMLEPMQIGKFDDEVDASHIPGMLGV